MWRMSLAHPVFGVGLSNCEHRVAEYTASGRGDSPHNNVLGMLAETGFVGAALYVALFVYAIGLAVWIAHQSDDSRTRWISILLAASLVGYLVGGMFMTRHTFPLAYLLAGGTLAISSPPTQPSDDDTAAGQECP